MELIPFFCFCLVLFIIILKWSDCKKLLYFPKQILIAKYFT